MDKPYTIQSQDLEVLGKVFNVMHSGKQVCYSTNYTDAKLVCDALNLRYNFEEFAEQAYHNNFIGIDTH